MVETWLWVHSGIVVMEYQISGIAGKAYLRTASYVEKFIRLMKMYLAIDTLQWIIRNSVVTLLRKYKMKYVDLLSQLQAIPQL